MKHYGRLISIGAVVLALFAGFWLRAVLDRARPPTPHTSKVRSVEARCGVAAGGALSSKELAITCGLDDAGVEAVIADAIGGLDLAGLVKGVRQGAADLPAEVDQMALRLGITHEAVVKLVSKLDASQSEEDITAASLARTITREKPLLVVNVIGTVSDARSGDVHNEIAVGGPSPEAETAQSRSGGTAENARTLAASETIIVESERLRAECGVVAGNDAELGIARIICGPNKEEVGAIINRLVEENQIDQVIADLRRGTFAQTQLLDAFDKELNLSRTTALTLLKLVADSGSASGQAAGQFGELAKRHLALTYRLGQLSVEGPEENKLRDLAAAAVSTGDFATAETLLRQWSQLEKTSQELLATKREISALQRKLDGLTKAKKADAVDEMAKTDIGGGKRAPRQERQIARELADEDAAKPFRRGDRVVLDFPAEVNAGAQFKIKWRGPAAPGDLIFVAPTDQAGNRYPGSDTNRHDASKGSPATLTAPAEPGAYEVRYLSYANAKPLAHSPLKVITPEVDLLAPHAVSAGSAMQFDWAGPDSPGDLLFIAAPAMEKNRYLLSDSQRHATSGGSPATLVAPAKEGDYEIRYFSYKNGTVLFAQSLVVTPPEVRLEAPKTVNPGARLKFSWIGPNAPGDMLFVAKRDLERNKYVTTDKHRHLTSDGPVAELVAPADPGNYEIRYYSYANGTVLGAGPLTVK